MISYGITSFAVKRRVYPGRSRSTQWSEQREMSRKKGKNKERCGGDGQAVCRDGGDGGGERERGWQVGDDHRKATVQRRRGHLSCHALSSPESRTPVHTVHPQRRSPSRSLLSSHHISISMLASSRLMYEHPHLSLHLVFSEGQQPQDPSVRFKVVTCSP